MPRDKLLNPLDYVDNPAELEVQRELNRLGIENDECPEVCPECGGEFETGGGFAGEAVVYCPNKECKIGIVWTDCEDAIRRVL